MQILYTANFIESRMTPNLLSASEYNTFKALIKCRAFGLDVNLHK